MNRTRRHYTDEVTKIQKEMSHVFTNMWILELNFQLHEFNLEMHAKSSKLKKEVFLGRGMKVFK